MYDLERFRKGIGDSVLPKQAEKVPERSSITTFMGCCEEMRARN
jgi:hypothetical protein